MTTKKKTGSPKPERQIHQSADGQVKYLVDEFGRVWVPLYDYMALVRRVR